MTLVAIYYHHGLRLPTVCDVGSKSKFIECCELIPTDWAHLMNKESGEILHTWRKDTLTVSQPTQPLSTEQSLNRLNRPEADDKMKGWKDIGQNITKKFDDRYENLGPFDDDWQELCIASTLRGLIDEFKDVYEIDEDEDDEYGVDFVISVRDIKQLIWELEK